MKQSLNDKKFKRVLIVKTSSMGDILHTFPAVSLISEIIPEAQIDWLVNPEFTELVSYHKSVSKIFPFPRRQLASPKTMIPSIRSIMKTLRAENYDLLIDFQGLIKSSFWSFFAKTDTIAGFAEPREKISRIFYNKKVKVPREIRHAVEKNIYLVCGIFNRNFQKPLPCPELKEKKESRKEIYKLLKSKGLEEAEKSELICISPGARWESKRWPTEFFAEIIEFIKKENLNCKFIITGSKDDTELSDEILSILNDTNNVFSVVGETSVIELFELIRMSRMLICNDSGPMHIASILNIPVFAMFGPTDPEKTGPYGKSQIIFQPKTDCIKCLKRYCPLEEKLCGKSLNSAKVAGEILNYVKQRR